MKVPAAVIYAVLAGFFMVSIIGPHVAAATLSVLCGIALVFMVAGGVDPLVSEFFIGTVKVSDEPESGD